MISAVTVLLIFQLIGEVTVVTLSLSIPGPVVGMLLLFIALLVRGSSPASLKETSQGILQHLSLLYVPAGVGVIVHFSLIKNEWFPIIITLVSSTIITMVISAFTMLFLMNRTKPMEKSKG